MYLRILEVKVAVIFTQKQKLELFPLWKIILEHECIYVKMNGGYTKYGFLFHTLQAQYIKKFPVNYSSIPCFQCLLMALSIKPKLLARLVSSPFRVLVSIFNLLSCQSFLFLVACFFSATLVFSLFPRFPSLLWPQSLYTCCFFMYKATHSDLGQDHLPLIM